MRFLAPLAAIFGFELEALTTEVRRRLIFGTLIGLALALAAIFALVAAYVALADALGAISAALVLSAGFLLLALVLYLGSQVGAAQRRRAETERRRENEAKAVITTAAVSVLPSVMKSRFGIPALALAAFLLFRRNER